MPRTETRTSFRDCFDKVSQLNPYGLLIKGSVCGILVEDIEAPLTQKIRWLDRFVDELAKGEKMEKILRTVD